MSLLTDTVILLADWENVSNGAGAVWLSNASGVYIEWCVATSQDDADLCDLGHRVYAPLLWEGSDSGQDLYMRTNAATVAAADLVDADYPQLVVTIYP